MPLRWGQDIEVIKSMLNWCVLFSNDACPVDRMFNPGPIMSGFRIMGLELLGPLDKSETTWGKSGYTVII